MRGRIGDLLACLALLALALFCFARLVANPRGLIVDSERPSLDHMLPPDTRGIGNDLTLLFLPHYQAITAQIDKTGRLPFWDNSGFAGRPMVGNPQGGLFYPPVWAAWWFRSPAALGWLTLAHVVWGGVGAYVLARGLRLGRFGSFVAAGCFQASPYLLAHVFEGHYPHVWAACWYPWAFWAFFNFQNGQRLGMLALPVILGMVFLTGHPQEWYYLVLALSIWAGIVGVRALRVDGLSVGCVKLAAWAILVGLSLGMVAIELIPGHLAQEWTLRGSKLTIGQASRYDAHSVNLFQLLNPFALGGPDDYVGDDNYWEQLLSIGLVPLVLATVASLRHSNRRLVYSLLAMTLTALAFALGRRLGLFIICFHVVPGMDRFRVPGRALFLVQIGTALMSGLGIEALGSLTDSRRIVSWNTVRTYLLGALALTFTSLCAVVVLCRHVDPYGVVRPSVVKDIEKADAQAKSKAKAKTKTTRVKLREPDDKHVAYRLPKMEPDRALIASSRVLGSGVFWASLAGCLLGIGILRAGGQRRELVVWGLGILALAELGSYGYSLLRVSPTKRFLEDDPVSRALTRSADSVSRPFRVRVCDAYYDDLHAASHGFEKTNINDWFQIQRAADLYQVLYPLFEYIPPPPAREEMGQALRDYGDGVRQGVLDRLGVAFLVSDHVDPNEPWPIVAKGSWKEKQFAIHHNPSALPRAYVVPHARLAPDSAPKELAQLQSIDGRDAVLMDRDPLGNVARRQAFRPAEYHTADSDHVSVQVATEAPGLLVVADTWMPGWTARLDGQDVPVLRGNRTQRVVALPTPGRHEVVMSYQPPGFVAGVAVSVVSLALWGIACCVAVRTGAGTSPRVVNTRARVPVPHFARAREAKRRDGPASSPSRCSDPAMPLA